MHTFHAAVGRVIRPVVAFALAGAVLLGAFALPVRVGAAANPWPHTIVNGFSTPSGAGYYLVFADGAVEAHGDAVHRGDASQLPLTGPLVGGGVLPSGLGYWLVGQDGGIFSYGRAAFHGSMGGIPLNQPVFSMTATATGDGYWLVAYDGGIFSFGDAAFYGSTGGLVLNQPINGISTSPSGSGYRMVARDGGIFSFGDVPFYGSLPGIGLAVADVVGMAPTPTNKGYWIARSNGSVHAFGDATDFGAYGASPFDPVAAIFSNPKSQGYMLVLASGATVPFGNAPGTPQPPPPAAPVISDNFPDPWVLYENGTYFAYSTNHGQPNCPEANVPVRISPDMANWTCSLPNDAMPTVPAWATKGKIWAPTVGRLDDGSHALYFASTRADGGWCVGSAFSESGPRGPFTPEPTPFVCQDALGGTIDPSFFRDVDGVEYLLYKSEGVVGSTPQQTWIRALRPDGKDFVGAESKLLETSLAWEGTVTENPSMIQAGGTYYVFYSGNLWHTSAYAIGYAVCDSARGPCTKPIATPLLSSQPGALGPGAPATFRDASGQPRLAYAAWTTTPCIEVECGNRSLFIRSMELSGPTVTLR